MQQSTPNYILLANCSQNVLRESQGIPEQFPGDPWIHFVKATLKFIYSLN